MNKFFDEEIEELYWGRLEEKLPHLELEQLRNKYDPDWCKPATKKKLAMIVEDTQGLIDKRYLL